MLSDKPPPIADLGQKRAIRQDCRGGAFSPFAMDSWKSHPDDSYRKDNRAPQFDAAIHGCSLPDWRKSTHMVLIHVEARTPEYVTVALISEAPAFCEVAILWVWLLSFRSMLKRNTRQQ